jgi:hypothetical protein
VGEYREWICFTLDCGLRDVGCLTCEGRAAGEGGVIDRRTVVEGTKSNLQVGCTRSMRLHHCHLLVQVLDKPRNLRSLCLGPRPSAVTWPQPGKLLEVERAHRKHRQVEPVGIKQQNARGKTSRRTEGDVVR